jgi:hypothetical protein
VIVAGHPGAGQLADHALGLGEGLGLLARFDLDPRRQRLDRVRIQPRDLGVADQEAVAGERPESAPQRAPRDEGRVLARVAARPGQLPATR